MLAGRERDLVMRLRRDCPRLGDPGVTSAIFQGLITSADHIYHLQRLGKGRYECKPKNQPAFEVELEDAIMRPVVSGEDVRRYETPTSNTYILFPYCRDREGAMKLIADGELKRRFPKAWAYLYSWKEKLQGREGGAFEDAEWYRFSRNQNIEKQDAPKLVVPRLVRSLRLSLDFKGGVALDNVDVGGILPAQGSNAAFGALLGVLNGPVANFVFRAISKPFQNDYRSANRQFIAPLPIPRATPEQQADVAARARDLQDLWTRRRAVLGEADERLRALGRARHRPQWLWPELPTREQVDGETPRQLRTYVDERRRWVDDKMSALETRKIAAFGAELKRGEAPIVRFERGALTLAFGDAEPAATIFLDDPDGRLIEAYWTYLFIAQSRRDAKSLAADLRRAPIGPDTPAARQFVERVADLTRIEHAIARAESAMNEILYNLYGLDTAERRLVEQDCKRRAMA